MADVEEGPATCIGAFSVSLTVQDLAKSRAFYEALGFRVTGGDAAKNWLVLRNGGGATVGLFQGMFARNMLTFNPGWDAQAKPLAQFADIRAVQSDVLARGLALTTPAIDAASTGPAYFMLADPDGNPILVDQHVASCCSPAGAANESH